MFDEVSENRVFFQVLRNTGVILIKLTKQIKLYLVLCISIIEVTREKCSLVLTS